jgi:hypothetical protein
VWYETKLSPPCGNRKKAAHFAAAHFDVEQSLGMRRTP